MASAVTVSPKGEAMSHGNRLGRRSFDAVALEAEIKRIGSLQINDLRSLWETTFGKKVPLVLTKDLMARMLAWHVQEQAFGGFDRATLKILEGYARGRPVEPERFRRLKPGTELVREYQGERHTVTVAPDGFIWRGATYGSSQPSLGRSPGPIGMVHDSSVCARKVETLPPSRKRVDRAR